MRAAGWSAGRFSARLRAPLGLAVVPAFIALPATAQSLRAFPPPFELSHGVVYVMLPISGSVTMPRQLFHRVWFDLPSADSTVVDHVDLETPVHTSSVIEIGPPLKGGPWAAFNGPSNDSGHRRMPLQLFGRSAFAQRYAIDYMLVDAEGRAMPVEDGDNDTYPGYGEEVIAVADGVVGMCHEGPGGPCEMSEPELRRHETPMRNQLIRFPR